jgi:cytoplasmic iron level regulating protein YaaA (DUF328/UPF0246 family)
MQKKALLALMLVLTMVLTGCTLVQKDPEVDAKTEIIRYGDTVVTKGVYAKMARGEMVRFMAEIGAQRPEQIKAFDRGYHFDEKRSTDTEYVFIRNMDK